MADYQAPVAWTCKYEDPDLDAAVRQVTFHQSFGPGFSTGVHVFAIRAQLDGEPWIDKLIKTIEEKKELKFYFEDVSGSKKTKPQSHLILGCTLGVYLDPANAPRNALYVHTVEKRIKLDMKEADKYYKEESLDKMIKKIVEDAGLEMDDELVEECKTPPEFQALIQPGITPHAFIMSQVIPRSVNTEIKGGYRLLSADGEKVGFCTPWYKADEEVKLRKEEVLGVKEISDSFEALVRGGSEWTTTGFDPLTKKKLEKKIEDTEYPTQLSSKEPLHKGTRSAWYPCRTQEAVDAWAAAIHDTQCWGYGFTVFVRGTDKIGESEKEIKPNLKISLEGTKYRETDKQKGLVAAATYEFKNQRLSIALHCFTNALET